MFDVNRTKNCVQMHMLCNFSSLDNLINIFRLYSFNAFSLHSSTLHILHKKPLTISRKKQGKEFRIRCDLISFICST